MVESFAAPPDNTFPPEVVTAALPAPVTAALVAPPVKGGPSLSDNDAKRERLKKIMADNESVALLAAYRAVYEHHKKDADGNTIPHEGEEINEFLSALVTGAGKLLTGLGGKALASKAAGTAAKGAVTTGAKVTTSGGALSQAPAVKKGFAGAVDKFKNMSTTDKFQTYMMAKDTLNTAKGAVNAVRPKGIQKGKGTTTVSASADLFDIVKGQLLDEGLSEEEIKDIMLTLTPDEIMSEMAVNPNIAAMDAKNKADMVARAKAKEVPQDVKDASKRQYTAGGPKDKGENKYTTQDKKTIIDYNKNK